MKIAIASGKGGTGKTTLSVNLAAYLSAEKALNITLIDADVEEPNSGLFLRGKKILSEKKYKKIPKWEKSKCIFCGKCKEFCNFNAVITLPQTVLILPELCHSCYACSELCPENALPMTDEKIGELNRYAINAYLTFIEGVMDIGQESAVPLIKQTKEYINNKLSYSDLTIYDAPPGTSCPVIETIKDVDMVFLVTEPTPFGLHDLKLAVETVRKLNKEFAVIINRDGIGDDKIISYCDRNKIEVIAKIPYSKDIAINYSKGNLLYDKFPELIPEFDKIFKYINVKAKQLA